MQIYNYHFKTGEYIGPENAVESPLEPGKYLIPAHATDQVPPVPGENQVAAFVADAWVLRADYRANLYYDKLTKEEHTINEIGVEPDPGWTDQAPGPKTKWDEETSQWIPDLQAYQASKIDEINAAFEAATREPVTVEINGTVYSMDGREDSARRMNEGLQLSELAGETVIAIVDYNNAVHMGVSLADGREIVKQQSLAYRANYYIRANLRHQALQAESIDDLAVIAWPGESA